MNRDREQLRHPLWLGFCESKHAKALLDALEYAQAVDREWFDAGFSDFVRLSREALAERKYELFGLRLAHVLALANEGVAHVSRTVTHDAFAEG